MSNGNLVTQNISVVFRFQALVILCLNTSVFSGTARNKSKVRKTGIKCTDERSLSI